MRKHVSCVAKRTAIRVNDMSSYQLVSRGLARAIEALKTTFRVFPCESTRSCSVRHLFSPFHFIPYAIFRGERSIASEARTRIRQSDGCRAHHLYRPYSNARLDSICNADINLSRKHPSSSRLEEPYRITVKGGRGGVIASRLLSTLRSRFQMNEGRTGVTITVHNRSQPSTHS